MSHTPKLRPVLLVFALASASLMAGAVQVDAATPSPAPTASSVHPSAMRQAADALAGPRLAAPAAAPAAPAEAAPAQPAPAAPAAPAASTLNRQVFGFAQAGALGDSTMGYPSWKFSLLSTVAYFGLHVNPLDGHLGASFWDYGCSCYKSDTGWSVWNSSTATNFINAAHSAGTNVVVTVIYQDTGAGMCTALQHQSTTIADTVAQVSSRGIQGVNIDYEGASAACGSSSNKALLQQFVAGMRNGLGAGAHLSIDTYGASAAPGGDGFFDLPGMAPYVSAFFVMAYELDNSNYSSVGCTRYCMSPTSPASFYNWNDQKVAAQYVATVGGSKTILGLPYYGWAACVTSATENAYPSSTPNWIANTQLGIQGLNLGAQHTDSHDGVDRWYTFASSTYNCQRELYIDDASSLSAKYQIVNRYGLQGAGIWSLDMGGGLTPLWNAIALNFSYVPAAPASVTACPGDGFATVRWTPAASPAAPVTSYAVSGSPAGSASTSGAASQAIVTGLGNGTPYTFQVQGSNAYGPGVTSDPSAAVTPSPPAGQWPARYIPTTPTRIVDTRFAIGGVSRLGPGQTATFDPRGQAGVPATGVQAIFATFTVAGGTSNGYLTVFPSQTCQPLSSIVNYGTGQQAANSSLVALGSDGRVAVFNGSGGSVDLMVDVSGWASTQSAADGHYRALAPQRLLDTRSGTGEGGVPARLGPGQSIDLAVAGAGGVPATGAAAVAINLTATNPTAYSYLSVVPTGSAQPAGTSNLNFGPGQTLANRAIVRLGTGGKVTIYNSQGSTDVLVDVNGFFTDGSDPTTAASGGLFTNVTPVRVLDTRDGTGGQSAPIGPNSWLSFPAAGLPGVPATGVSGLVFNLTTTGGSAASFLSVGPTQVSSVTTSDLNFTRGQTVANLVLAKVGGDGRVYVYNSQGSTAVIVDLIGWVG